MIALRCRVAGVTFVEGYPTNLVDLIRRTVFEDVDLDLVREEDNADDLYAVRVEVEGRHLGYLPRSIAAVVGPQIDEGTTWRACIVYVAVDVEHRDRPGLEVELRTP